MTERPELLKELLSVVSDETLDPDERTARATGLMAAAGAAGATIAVERFSAAPDAVSASYFANYLSLLPDLRTEKAAVIEHALVDRPEVLGAATNLVKFAPEPLVGRCLAHYLEDPERPGAGDVGYEAAVHHPRLTQRHRNDIVEDDLLEAMVPGSDPDFVAGLVASYRGDPDPQMLRTLSFVRTDDARAALIELEPSVPEDDREDWETYLENCGIFAENRLPTAYPIAYRGFVVDRAVGPHPMGGGFEHEVPSCPVCETPGTRLLTLRDVGIELDLGGDPSFFWFGCDCDAFESLLVRCTPGGTEGLLVETRPESTEALIVPGAPALLLEVHSTQLGYGIEMIPGFANHQVGGYPPWAEVERHPHCPECAQSMPFLAAVDSGMTVFGPMRFDGIVLGFWCADCSISCSRRQFG